MPVSFCGRSVTLLTDASMRLIYGAHVGDNDSFILAASIRSRRDLKRSVTFCHSFELTILIESCIVFNVIRKQ